MRSKPAPGVNSTVSSFHVKRQMQQARGCCYHERCSRIFYGGTKKFSVISALGDPSCWFSQSNLSGYMPLTPANWSNRQKLVSLYAVVSCTGHLSYLILHHWFLLGLQPLCNMHQDQQLDSSRQHPHRFRLWSSGLSLSVMVYPTSQLISSHVQLILEAFEVYMCLWSRRKSPGKQFTTNTQLLKNIYIC